MWTRIPRPIVKREFSAGRSTMQKVFRLSKTPSVLAVVNKRMQQLPTIPNNSITCNRVCKRTQQRGLAAAFDLAAFRLSMIAPVKKSVNPSRTVANMRETGWEQQTTANNKKFVFAAIRQCDVNSLLVPLVMWNLRFPLFWSCVSLRGDEIKLWLTPSAKQRRNPCSGLPAVYPDLSTRHDWPVKKGLCFVCRDRQSG